MIKYISILTVFITGIFFCLFSSKISDSTELSEMFQPKEMAAAQHSRSAVLANLGGVKVNIPNYFADYVEYDPAPVGLNKEKNYKKVDGDLPKITSFGFDVRYPDMEGKSTPELLDSFINKKIRTSQWILVGFNSGNNYKSPGGINRMALGMISISNESNPRSWWNIYEKLSDKQYGLDVYVHPGIDGETGISYRNHRNANDVFFKKNDNGEVITYIKCSNRDIPSAPCTHHFDLEPKIKSTVRIVYRRGLLQEWKNIQDKVEEKVLSFIDDGNN